MSLEFNTRQVSSKHLGVFAISLSGLGFQPLWFLIKIHLDKLQDQAQAHPVEVPIKS